MNRLSDSTSLYLRQHADDPVEWWPWGDAAFTEAAERDVPVLLSVGYSACHWCHVMQRESFRDPETAAIINTGFVPIKVDREQRPDIDTVYMDYVTATVGHGGWPMTVFLTSERLPVLGGTYFPREAMGRTPAFADILAEVSRAYRADRERLEETSRAARAFLEDMAAPKQARDITPLLVETAAHMLLMTSDAKRGGFGSTAKFPQFGILLFLSAFQRVRADREVAFVLRHALESMLRGGLQDHVGGGIFRYTVDREWQVPHFEKMLSDNGLLLRVLAAAHALDPSDDYASAASACAAWLEREMRLPDGPFASAMSADTGGAEGATYTWTHAELAEALTAEELALAEESLGVTEAGDLDGANVVTLRAGRTGDTRAVDALLAKLAGLRAARPLPDRDDKAVVSWNAIAARGLIEAGRAFGDPAMTGRGVALTRLLLDRTRGGVVHVLDDPSVAGVRLVEDHAHLAAAALSAFEATGEPGLLAEARRVHAETEGLFLDGTTLWMTSAHTDLPVRPREQSDDPVPSGASTFVENLNRIALIDRDAAARARAAELLRGWWTAADYAPQTAGVALAVMAEHLWGDAG